MKLQELKKKFKVKITAKQKVEFLLEEVMQAKYGTKNRARLILLLTDIKNSLTINKG